MTGHDELRVHVELEGETVPVGRAQFHRSRGELTSTTFQYDVSYLSDPRAYSVDPDLALVSGTQYTRGLPGAFVDSAPDRWGRNLVKKRERVLARRESRRPRTLDDVDFLVGVSDITRQGALRFRDDTSSEFLDPASAVPKLIRLPELLRAADAAARDSDDYEAVKTLLAAGTGSLGGTRPKAAVLADDDRQLIAKLPHHEDDWDVLAWEATAQDLASAAGVRVAPHRLTRIGGRHVLLLERFDRDRAGARIGYISAMTLLGQRDGDPADYADIAERLPEVSARASDDARQLFRRVAVSVGLNNTDDHLRNHGFLHERGGWSLSPAFDVNPNPDPDLRQTMIAGADQTADEGEGLMVLAGLCRLRIDDARAVVAEVCSALSSWQDVAIGNGVPRSQLGRFEDCFAAGLATLRAA